MKSNLRNSWQGMAALIFALAVWVVFPLMSDFCWHHPGIARPFWWGWFCWGWLLLVPLLAFWGLWRGSTVNKVCAILALCFEGLFLLSSIVWM